MHGLLIPPELEALIVSGWWPRTAQEVGKQNLTPLISRERVRALVPNAHTVYFCPPPFSLMSEGHWYTQPPDPLAQPPRTEAKTINVFDGPEWALHEIDPTLAMDIGDFGAGSDSPIILDYRPSLTAPRLMYLRWGVGGPDRSFNNHWVELAPTFADFAATLGLPGASTK